MSILTVHWKKNCRGNKDCLYWPKGYNRPYGYDSHTLLCVLTKCIKWKLRSTRRIWQRCLWEHSNHLCQAQMGLRVGVFMGAQGWWQQEQMRNSVDGDCYWSLLLNFCSALCSRAILGREPERTLISCSFPYVWLKYIEYWLE